MHNAGNGASYLPRTGDGAFYLGQGRFQINVIPINNITWTGDAFSFRMDARLPFSRTFEATLWGGHNN